MEKRNPALDVIRTFALFCVISVHYFLHSGFYHVPVLGVRMLVMVFARQFFMICVPLFIMLTGYLMNGKELSKRYYLGLVKTVAIYVLASIACLLFKVICQDAGYGAKVFLLKTLDFTGANYSWYIEMYIGLFLLIPFLNLAYHGLKTKREKQWLIATLLLLSSAPALLNTFSFQSLSWWAHPTSSFEYQKLIPAWWTGIYPIMYYFIGAYLKEYGLSLHKKARLPLLAVALLVNGLYSIYRSYGLPFVWGTWASYHSPLVVAVSVLVFQVLLDIPWFRRSSASGKKRMKTISDCVLGAYLLSFILDDSLYPKLKLQIDGFAYRFEFYFLIVPFIFVCSLCGSWILELLYRGVCSLFAFLRGRLRNKASV